MVYTESEQETWMAKNPAGDRTLVRLPEPPLRVLTPGKRAWCLGPLTEPVTHLPPMKEAEQMNHNPLLLYVYKIALIQKGKATSRIKIMEMGGGGKESYYITKLRKKPTHKK